jgi:Arc/MetJ family transcription regulator
MGSVQRVTVSLDAAMIAQAREQLGAPAAGLADGAVIERAVNAYLLRRMVDATQAASGLSESDAERIAYEELAASRRERRGGG